MTAKRVTGQVRNSEAEKKDIEADKKPRFITGAL
jgi:hypothetical protein